MPDRRSISAMAITSSTPVLFDDRVELFDLLAGFVAVKGARGVVVFDGDGQERVVGQLDVRLVPCGRTARAACRRAPSRRGRLAIVSSDATVRETSGQEVRNDRRQGPS